MEEGYKVAALHKYKLFKLELLGLLSVGKTHLSSFVNFVCVMDDPISTIVGIIGVASLRFLFEYGGQHGHSCQFYFNF